MLILYFKVLFLFKGNIKENSLSRVLSSELDLSISSKYCFIQNRNSLVSNKGYTN